MSYEEFPNDSYFVQITASDEATLLCKITTTERTDLGRIVVHAQKVGTHTTETLQIEVHNDETFDIPIYTSDVYSYTDFEITASHWAGTLTFDFDHVPLNPNIYYWIKIRALNYSYTDDVKYIAVAMDWPDAINTAAIAGSPGAAVGIYGYK